MQNAVDILLNGIILAELLLDYGIAGYCQLNSCVILPHMSIQKRDETNLVMHGGYHKTGYCYCDKEQIPVKFENGMQIDGMVYIMDKTKNFGLPTKGYYFTTLQGHRDCGLDTNVLEKALQKSMQQVQNRNQTQENQTVQEHQEPLQPQEQMRFV